MSVWGHVLLQRTGRSRCSTPVSRRCGAWRMALRGVRKDPSYVRAGGGGGGWLGNTDGAGVQADVLLRALREGGQGPSAGSLWPCGGRSAGGMWGGGVEGGGHVWQLREAPPFSALPPLLAPFSTSIPWQLETGLLGPLSASMLLPPRDNRAAHGEGRRPS